MDSARCGLRGSPSKGGGRGWGSNGGLTLRMESHRRSDLPVQSAEWSVTALIDQQITKFSTEHGTSALASQPWFRCQRGLGRYGSPSNEVPWGGCIRPERV